MKLRLEQEKGAAHWEDQEPSRLKVYESSVRHSETGESLLSVITHRNGDGLRITHAQAEELRDFLTEWIQGRLQ